MFITPSETGGVLQPVREAIDSVLDAQTAFCVADASIGRGMRARTAIYCLPSTSMIDQDRWVGLLREYTPNGNANGATTARGNIARRVIEEHRQMGLPGKHLCVAGMCRQFELQGSALRGVSRLEAQHEPASLGQYILMLLGDTFLAPAAAPACDWLEPSNRNQPAFSALRALVTRYPVFVNRPLVSAASRPLPE